MPIDLDLFVFQLSDLGVSRFALRGAVGMLKAKGALRGFLSASPGVPGPAEEEALDVVVQGGLVFGGTGRRRFFGLARSHGHLRRRAGRIGLRPDRKVILFDACGVS